MKISLPDSICTELTGEEEPTPERVVEVLLARMPHLRQLSVRDRVVVVLPPERQALEKDLDIGSLEHGKQLVDKIRPLLALKVGPIEVPLSPSELGRINQQAVFMGQDLHAYMQQLVKDVLTEAALRY